jgi:hypothetical protein
MARLSQSQLAGFRIGTEPDPALPSEPKRRSTSRPADTSHRPPVRPEPSPSSSPRATNPSPLGPVPPAPTRHESRHKIGLTLPLDLAHRVRATTQQGYALADLVMVAYQHHRDQLLDEHQAARPRQLVRRDQGRSPLTVALSSAERAALDTLAQRLGWTRSHTVAMLLQHQLSADGASDDR